MYLIDYSKIFDGIDDSRLWNTFRSMGVPQHLIILIKSLYKNQEAAVRTEYGNTEWFKVREGVRQGCVRSPYLFNMYNEYILRKVGSADNVGIKVGGSMVYVLMLTCKSHCLEATSFPQALSGATHYHL
jgi:hypothetical protein